MQLMWKYALPVLLKLEKEYDVAISYLWPHYFIAEKVKLRKKLHGFIQIILQWRQILRWT